MEGVQRERGGERRESEWQKEWQITLDSSGKSAVTHTLLHEESQSERARRSQTKQTQSTSLWSMDIGLIGSLRSFDFLRGKQLAASISLLTQDELVHLVQRAFPSSTNVIYPLCYMSSGIIRNSLYDSAVVIFTVSLADWRVSIRLKVQPHQAIVWKPGKFSPSWSQWVLPLCQR